MPPIDATVKSPTLVLLLAALLAASPAWPATADDRNALERLVDRIPHKDRDVPWLTGDFNAWSGVASAAVLGAAIDRAGDDHPVGGLGGQGNEGGDVVQFGHDVYRAIPAVGYVTSLAARDYRGFAYLGIHDVTSSAVTKFLKTEIGQQRPGNQADTSFPSGHTSGSFLGAAFLQQRYGARWGVPAYVSALLVGWSRVYGNLHYVNDIVGGASISMMSAWAIVPPYEPERLERWRDLERERPFRYEWELTLNDVDNNLVQAPLGTGDTFQSPLDRNANEPWANSRATLEYRVDDDTSIHGMFSPWEIRSFGRFTQPTEFAGVLFPADEDLRVAHLMWTFGAQYRKALVANERLVTHWGLGVAGQYTEEEVFVVDPAQPEQRGLAARTDASALYGVVHCDVDVKLFWKLHLEAEADVGIASDNRFVDSRVGLEARLNPKWDIAVGWREFETDLKDSALRNDFRRSGPAVILGYAF